jgi:hypothetical protein
MEIEIPKKTFEKVEEKLRGYFTPEEIIKSIKVKMRILEKIQDELHEQDFEALSVLSETIPAIERYIKYHKIRYFEVLALIDANETTHEMVECYCKGIAKHLNWAS